jgi:predicted dehydrogenase
MSLQIAIVGTGKVAMESYLPQLVRHADVKLLYFNRTREKALALAECFGGHVMDSLAELVQQDPDAVMVLTHETERLQVSQELLEFRPRRLFFEKPLVAKLGQASVSETDFLEAHALLEKAQAVGTQTAMVFNYRFLDQTLKARALIEELNLGKPVHFTGLVHYACWSHCIDLLLEIMGSVQTITALAATTQRSVMGAEGISNVMAAFQFGNDASGTLIGTGEIDFKLPLFELSFAFEHGRISMRDLDGDLEVLDYRSACQVTHALSRDGSRWDQYQASFGKAIAAYLESVRSGTPAPVPGLAGLRELQFEAALKRSIHQARPVVLEQDFPINPILLEAVGRA